MLHQNIQISNVISKFVQLSISKLLIRLGWQEGVHNNYQSQLGCCNSSEMFNKVKTKIKV